MICLQCKRAADAPSPDMHTLCEWPVSCGCQHRTPGSWNHTHTAAHYRVPVVLPEPPRCGTCGRRVALTPKSRRLVRHKQRWLVDVLRADGNHHKVITNYTCPGSGKVPQSEESQPWRTNPQTRRDSATPSPSS